VFDSVLRRELTTPEATLKDGKMALPEGAGLGIALNDDLIDRLRVT
jgi:L-alanine-DL-glutamate epimerase-like enolase superfamily enzyme